MIHRNLATLFLSGLILFTLIGCQPAPTVEEFSADIVTTTPKATYTSKMFVKGQKQCLEETFMGYTIDIFRLDKKVIWTLFPEHKTYMEFPLKEVEAITFMLHDPTVKIEKKFLANEKIDGHPTNKYHVTITSDGRKEIGYMWEATDLKNLPIQWQDEDKTYTETWKNIKFGSISDSLFEIPAGYKKV